MAELAARFRERAPRIVHVVRLYLPDGSNVDVVHRHSVERGRPRGRTGTLGWQIAPQLLPTPMELDHELLLSAGFQGIGHQGVASSVWISIDIDSYQNCGQANAR
jgi:hypothetical protein